MAYINQEQKAKIALKLKGFIPKSWKWSLSIDNHSTLVLTISKGPKALLESDLEGRGYIQVNEYHLEKQFKDNTILEIFQEIKKAMNTDNYDHSDAMTDYFDVGHYIDINIGRWNKPYQVTD